MNVYRLVVVAVVLASAAPLRAGILPAHELQQLRFAARWPSATARQTPHPAVVRVIAPERGGMSLGSGTLVDANDEYGLVITNWHVVRDAAGPVEVVFADGFRSPGNVVRMDREWDLASVLIWKPPVQPVPVTNEAPRPGEWLSIAGYGSGNYRMQTGRCTQYLAPGKNKPFEMVELDAAARQGDSGGPIFNSRGELAGVLFGEGDGRTTGSYGGRVQKFLHLTAMDLQRLPAANIAANKRSSPPSGGAAARFSGGIHAPENGPTALADGSPNAPRWLERPAPQIAQRPQTAQPRPAAIAAAPAAASNKRSSTPAGFGHVAGEASGIWTVWGDEIKTFLAAFGVAAIVLHLLRWSTKKV